jgi:IS605 OrfB family transposase
VIDPEEEVCYQIEDALTVYNYKRLGKIKSLSGKERRIVNQQLHATANEIVAYAKQFTKPVIVMEDLTGIRKRFKGGKRLNRRFHSLPFRRLQELVEYKALLQGIETRYLTKDQTRNTTRECHRCGHVAPVSGRTYRCAECGLEYDRDLNAAVNIAQRLMRELGWGSCDAPEPASVTEGAKPRPNAGSSSL